MRRIVRPAVWLGILSFLAAGLAVPLAGSFMSAFSEQLPDGRHFTLAHIGNVLGCRMREGRLLDASIAAALVLAGGVGLLLALRAPRREGSGRPSAWRRALRLAPFAAAAGVWLLLAVRWDGGGDVRLVLTSLRLAAAATLGTMILALPLAALAARAEWPGKRWLMPLLLLPMIAPPFVGAIGMKRLLGCYGMVNHLLLSSGLLSEPLDLLGTGRFWGVVIVEVLHLYPVMYLNLAAALANIDPSMEEASASLGAGRLRTWSRITLPLAFPGLFAGASVVFIWAFTDLGTPLIFDYGEVAAKRIYDQVASERVNPAGHALTVVVLATSALIFWMGRRALRSQAAIGRVAVRSRERRLGPLGTAAAVAAVLAVAALAMLPHLAVALTSVADRWFLTALPESYTTRHLATAAGHDLVASGVRNSLVYSGLSTAITVVLGLAAAIMVVRGGGRRGALLDALMMVPLAVPGLVLAFGYLGAYSGLQPELPAWLPAPWLQKPLSAVCAAIDPRNSPAALLVMAYAVRRVPLVFRSAAAGLEQCPAVLEEASASLGAGGLTTLRRVTLPLVGANLAAGAVLAFSYAMLEVSDSMILALDRVHYPITKVIYTLFGRIGDGEGVASAMGLLAMLILAASLFSASMFVGRRLGQMFRV